ncbi:MAG: hypothetical protein NTV49_04020 [Kiritimatiellaeota bacterium]|nr:hypothetical protein [Kiritimatiellota bacterium]
MKRCLTLGLLLGLASCGPPVEQPPAGKPAAEKKDSVLSNVADVITQRPVLEAGQRAADTIRKAAAQENQQLKEVEAP